MTEWKLLTCNTFRHPVCLRELQLSIHPTIYPSLHPSSHDPIASAKNPFMLSLFHKAFVLILHISCRCDSHCNTFLNSLLKALTGESTFDWQSWLDWMNAAPLHGHFVCLGSGPSSFPIQGGFRILASWISFHSPLPTPLLHSGEQIKYQAANQSRQKIVFPNCCGFQSEYYYKQKPSDSSGSDGIIAPSAASSTLPSSPTKTYTHQLPVEGNLRESEGSSIIPDRIKDCSRLCSEPTESGESLMEGTSK